MKPLLLDGPMGTEIDRRGGDTTIPLWSARSLIENPELILEIHRDYVDAGADTITTNSFRTQEYTFTKAGLPDQSQRLTQLAVDLAHNSGAKMVAGSIAPIEDCYSPHLTPSNDILGKQFAKLVKNLQGVDVFLIETMNSLREAKVAYHSVRNKELPIWLSFTCDDDGKILSGDTWADVVEYFIDRVQIIGVNCTSLTGSDRAITQLLELDVKNWSIYPNFGNINELTGWTAGLIPEKYNNYIERWISMNPAMIGTCCGATPHETQYLRKSLDELF